MATGSFTATAVHSSEVAAQTPTVQLFHQRCGVKGAIDFAALDAEVELLRRTEAEMMHLPITCAADFAAKVIVDTAEAGRLSDKQTGQIWQDARALTGCAV
jgi:hypothetical protein